jgi:hypothetical protein
LTNSLHEPSSAQIRDTLLSLPDGPVKVWVGRNFTSIDGCRARMGFLYQYLVAGRVSEVFGKYGPQRRHAVELKVDGIPAVMFVVKTAKRKSERGWTLRPATLPLDPKYEPLSSMVLEYIKGFEPEEYPFSLAENPDTSRRYAEAYTRKIFEEYKWRFASYSRSAFADPSLKFTFDPVTRRRTKIHVSTLGQLGEKISFEKVPGWVPVSVEVDSRWKDVNTHEFRKRRIRDLLRPYLFDGEERMIYAGWEDKEEKKGSAEGHYLELDLDESLENIRKLADMSKRYFKKLLISIETLTHPESMEIGGIEIIG